MPYDEVLAKYSKPILDVAQDGRQIQKDSNRAIEVSEDRESASNASFGSQAKNGSRAWGAHELAFSAHGEIGPLDIQMAKKDELWESESGFTVITALTALSENAQDAFDHFLVSLTTRSGGRITVRTASEIAAKLTQALYAPIADQIDPIHMGEVKRSMAIAKEYGERLVRKSGLCAEERLGTLISGYPSHSFVIDRNEAKEIFKPSAVRDCTPDEQALLEDLDDFALIPQARGWVRFISDDILEEESNNAAENRQAIMGQPATAGSASPADGVVPPQGEGGQNGKAGTVQARG